MTATAPTPPLPLTARELAYCGLFGAGALLLPVLFHALRLGSIFLPMYLPLVALAFFVRPAAAATTALVTPLLSGALTGMPPFFPPVAVAMALELAAMAGLLAWLDRRFPAAPTLLVLLPVLLLGRALYLLFAFLLATVLTLPAEFVAVAAVLKGWPGVILMLVVIPGLCRAVPATKRRPSP